MGQIQVTDEWLYRYMPMVDEALIRELEDSTDYEYRFSRKFQRKMRRLVWREAHRWLYTAYRIGRAAAVVVLVACSLFLASLSAEGNRIKFFDTVRSQSESLDEYTQYTYFVNRREREILQREPGYVPEGYREIDRHQTKSLFTLIYENDRGSGYGGSSGWW